MRFDICVIGAGPAGSITASEFAGRGFKVALLDRAKFPRPKVCGEGLMPQGVHLLKTLKLHDEVYKNTSPYFSIEFITEPGSLPLNFDVGEYGLSVKRVWFDEWLLKKAVARGVEFRGCTEAKNISKKNGSWEICADSGNLKCDFLILATGAGAEFARTAGFSPLCRADSIVCCQVRFDSKLFPRDRVTVIILREGELYLSPHLDEINSAFLLRRKNLRRKQIVESISRALHIENPIELRSVKVRPRIMKGAFKNNCALVGDAFAVNDPLVGHGISFAIFSGISCAQRLLEYTKFGKDAMLEYENEVTKLALSNKAFSEFAVKLTSTSESSQRILKFSEKYGLPLLRDLSRSALWHTRFETTTTGRIWKGLMSLK